jgi:phenylacetate-CoA ligase
MMRDLTPDPATLDPIEIASRDEIAALQLDRLRWSLRHAYENVPHYRHAFDAPASTPTTCVTCPTSRNSPSP